MCIILPNPVYIDKSYISLHPVLCRTKNRTNLPIFYQTVISSIQPDILPESLCYANGRSGAICRLSHWPRFRLFFQDQKLTHTIQFHSEMTDPFTHYLLATLYSVTYVTIVSLWPTELSVTNLCQQNLIISHACQQCIS